MADLYLYNPTCDMAVENGTFSYMPPKLLAKFEQDISPLMAFMTTGEDDLISENGDNDVFLDFWNQLGIGLPSFVNKENTFHRSYKQIIPWGWSPIVAQKYAPAQIYGQPFPFKQAIQKDFFSRLTSVRLTTNLKSKALPDFISIPHLPQVIRNFDHLNECFESFSIGIVVKTLWSSSGRGLLFIRNQSQLQQGKAWIDSQLKKHKALIAEPIYTKVQDASLQFMITQNGKYLFYGINYFEADDQGHFSKEFFHIPDSIRESLPTDEQWIQQTADAIIKSMQELNIHKNYQGPIGIDAMFVKINDQIKFYPLVEANLRCNMGLINLHLKKLFAAGCCGTWQISSFNPGEAPKFIKKQMKLHPAEIKNMKITRGFFPLTYFNPDTRFAAWGIIE
jgi:hypothetical protein